MSDSDTVDYDDHDDLKKVLQQAGMEDQATVFLFVDTQIKNEQMVEDMLYMPVPSNYRYFNSPPTPVTINRNPAPVSYTHLTLPTILLV